MNKEEMRQWIAREGDKLFSRSGGAGGQNVNKVNTKVTLKLPVAEMPLSAEERNIILEKLAGRINSAGDLVGMSTDTRSQIRNRRIAEERAFLLIDAALKKKKKRTPTNPGRGAREKRMKLKKERGQIKKLRGEISD